MFVEHEVVVPMPIIEVGARLLARLVEVEGLGSAAYRHGEDLRSRVGPVDALAKEVVVAIDRPQMTRAGLVLPVTWRATGAQALFPRLRGDLVVRQIDEHTTALRLRASYRPPFGWIGGVVDRLLLARFARVTIEDWLDRVAASLERDTSATPEPALRPVPPSTTEAEITIPACTPRPERAPSSQPE